MLGDRKDLFLSDGERRVPNLEFSGLGASLFEGGF